MAMVSVERSCTFLVHFDKAASQSEIKEALEGSDSAAKVQAMQKAIMMLLNGESLPALFITIVRYVLPSEDHTIQKLLLLYLVRICSCSLPRARGSAARQRRARRVHGAAQETIEKTDSSGKLLPEMVSP